MHNGKPLDRSMTRRTIKTSQALATIFPNLGGKLGAMVMEKRMRKRWPDIDPAWQLLPAKKPIINGGLLMTDDLVPHLMEGSVIPVPGIKRFATDGSSIELTNGTVLESIDAVIFATGYYFDYSYLSPEADPTTFPASEFNDAPNSNGLIFPRLYQGLFSTKYPESLAFSGPFRGHSFTAFSNADLNAQAICQVWLGNYPMASEAEREAWCDASYASALWQIRTYPIGKVGVNPKTLETWLNDAAGNGLNYMFSWLSWDAWKFWWNERELYKLIMDGVNTPHIYRLFESSRGDKGRKSWTGAREAIYRANGKAYEAKTQ